MGEKNKRKQRTPAGQEARAGLKMCISRKGTAKESAKSKDTVSKLARHVGMSPWPQSLVAPKAMSTLETPEFEEPAVPTREY